MAGPEPSEEKVSRKKGYAPTDDDYHIESIRISEAENGVVIECSYELNDDAKDKVKKDRHDGIYTPDSYCPPEKHVFESKADAKAFIVSELESLWAGEEGDERS